MPRKGVELTTAIIGVGNIGTALARHLVSGDETVVVAAKNAPNADALAQELGSPARSATVENAIADADAVVFALWLDDMKDVISQYASLLEGKVVIDPSNPLAFDATGQFSRSLPDDQWAGGVVTSLLPAGARYVKAFGTLSAEALAADANREPDRAVLFYATDDDEAAKTVERLIRAAGFDPLKAGGAVDAKRLEAPTGDLHQFALNGELVDLNQARAAIAARKVTA
jgi:8-hydroxy-5-deazaflavin:NADPH oxidoreductase